MYDGFSKRLMRLSRRLTGPRAVGRALKQVADLVNTPWVVPPPPPPPAAAAPAAKRGPTPQPPPPPRPARVVEVEQFGSNPGALRMLMYLPASLPRSGGPLVVVLHGCGQHAETFAAETGWLAMAERLGFAVVMPEQVAANNAGRCFNWFRGEDAARDAGEALSIRQMVEMAAVRASLDPRRVYVVGLSAGGAMAAAMLVAYPEVFAAGASVAGLPVGCASDVTSALARMSRAGTESPAELAARARSVGPKTPPRFWPRIAIWQGDADHTVVAANGVQLAAQFAALHEIPGDGQALPARGNTSGREWKNARGAEVELRTISGFPHAYPIGEGAPTDRFILPVGIDATEAIAQFWGLLPLK